MPINPESTWKSSFKIAMTPTGGSEWAANLTHWVAKNSKGMQLKDITGALFTFSSTFEQLLLANVRPSTDKSSALQKFVDAWGKAATASLLSVSNGSGFEFSLINASGIPTNVSIVKTTLKATLMSGTNTASIGGAVLPGAFRNAFLQLIYLVTGTGVPPVPPPPIAPFSGTSGTV